MRRDEPVLVTLPCWCGRHITAPAAPCRESVEYVYLHNQTEAHRAWAARFEREWQ